VTAAPPVPEDHVVAGLEPPAGVTPDGQPAAARDNPVGSAVRTVGRHGTAVHTAAPPGRKSRTP
jgi:hypothetical protein